VSSSGRARALFSSSATASGGGGVARLRALLWPLSSSGFLRPRAALLWRRICPARLLGRPGCGEAAPASQCDRVRVLPLRHTGRESITWRPRGLVGGEPAGRAPEHV